MIAAFVLHALIVGACCAAAAWAAERALAAIRAPRRVAWLLGMLASVVIPLSAVLRPEVATPPAIDAAGSVASAPAVPAHIVMNLVQLPALPAHDSLELAMAWGWGGLSCLVLAIYLATAWRLARRARDWVPGAQGDVLVADDIGPAVFGLLRPRVVLPRWLENATETTQGLVLQHERQHVAARDPQLLAMALLLVALFPWNLPLLWQARRLRFALELDCDRRVLAADTDPFEYGEALLLVNQRHSPTPAGAIALIERPSQLEQRIRIMTTHRSRRSIAALAAVMAAVCSFAATSITAPALNAPLKPTPSGAAALRLGQHFERMLMDRFPGLLDEEHQRMPMVVVLLNEDWSIERAAQVVSRDELPVDERTFGVIGLAKEDVPYVGNMGMQSPNNPKHVVLIVYTERNTPGKRFVSHVFPDTRAVDREIFRRYFPQAAKSGVPAGQQVWVLLDREGHVLRSGQEAVDSAAWNRTLENRFPGIKTQGITVTPITNDAGEPLLDGAGKDLHLHSVWLAPGSPTPIS